MLNAIVVLVVELFEGEKIVTAGTVVSIVTILAVEPTKLFAESFTQTLNVFEPSDWLVWFREHVVPDSVIVVFVPSSNRQFIGFVSVNVKLT